MATALKQQIIECISCKSACALYEQNKCKFNDKNTASGINRLAILAAAEDNTSAFHLLRTRGGDDRTNQAAADSPLL
jgi:hypothetical protein